MIVQRVVFGLFATYVPFTAFPCLLHDEMPANMQPTMRLWNDRKNLLSLELLSDETHSAD